MSAATVLVAVDQMVMVTVGKLDMTFIQNLQYSHYVAGVQKIEDSVSHWNAFLKKIMKVTFM